MINLTGIVLYKVGNILTAIQASGYRKLAEGDVVEFEFTKGEKGLKAEEVTVLEHASE
jgi:hypothetical protein